VGLSRDLESMSLLVNNIFLLKWKSQTGKSVSISNSLTYPVSHFWKYTVIIFTKVKLRWDSPSTPSCKKKRVKVRSQKSAAKPDWSRINAWQNLIGWYLLCFNRVNKRHRFSSPNSNFTNYISCYLLMKFKIR